MTSRHSFRGLKRSTTQFKLHLRTEDILINGFQLNFKFTRTKSFKYKNYRNNIIPPRLLGYRQVRGLVSIVFSYCQTSLGMHSWTLKLHILSNPRCSLVTNFRKFRGLPLSTNVRRQEGIIK